MLMAAKTISQSFQNMLTELSLIRSNWTEAYATELAGRIDDTFDNYLGLDKQKELRQATLFLSNIQNPAIKNLSFLKTQIEVDFKDEANEILNILGYSAKWQTVQQGDQEGLIEMLYTFKKGMTEELKTQITEKGTNPTLIETIISYAAEMQQANITQESLKQTSQQLTEEGQLAFNAIYSEVIGICKIASKYFQDNPLKKEQFTFSRVVRKMGSGTTPPAEEEGPTAP